MSVERTLLILDDEPKVVDVLSKTFEGVYQVLTSTRPTEALELLKQNKVHLILTDERMPNMGGMEFLKEARKINTYSVNIILTAYSDITVAIDAINSGIVYRYIVKPWDTEELRLIIRQAFERYELKEKNKSLTDELIKKNNELEENLIMLTEAQEKLLRTEKLITVGQLTASIGHELKNPLSRIKSAASLLRTEFEDEDEETKELLRIVDNEVMISTKIINDLLDFSRDRKADLKLNNLEKIIDNTLSRLKFPINVKVDRASDGTSPDLYLDDGQIQQILVNLIMNSIQSMEENGGKLYIQTTLLKEGVKLVIKDTGCGIPKENLEKIFEPLYTTKPKGIGLGMSVVKMLIEKHGGIIQIESRQNIGTVVTVTFPFKPKFMEN